MAKDCELEISITQMDAKGRGRGVFSESSKVEVIGTIPGDLVAAKLWKKRRGKWSADLLKILQPSAIRVAPRCKHVPECGGCSFQQMDYAAQLSEKQRRLEALFAPVVDASLIHPIIPCDNPWEYRNKMEFSFSQNKEKTRFLGLMIAGSRGRVFNLEECFLVSPWFSKVVASVRNWWDATELCAYRMDNTGSLRTLIVREGKRTGHKLVMLTVSGNPEFALNASQISAFTFAIKETVPEEEWAHVSIFLRIQQLQKGSPTQFFEMNLFGPDHYEERLEIGNRILNFKVSPTSFFQPNPLQAEKLYAEALKKVASRKKHVMDLYAGTATLSMVMAQIAELVTAIELNPEACLDAEANLERNGIKNLKILCGDVGKTLSELKANSEFIPPDLIIVDPPRTGLDSQALSLIAQLQADEILYISCNPATQVLNVQELMAAGYSLVSIQPVDQFPHTVHLETIALLKRIA